MTLRAIKTPVQRYKDGSSIIDANEVIAICGNKWISSMPPSAERSKMIERANAVADDIVRAVNAHDQLVEFLVTALATDGFCFRCNRELDMDATGHTPSCAVGLLLSSVSGIGREYASNNGFKVR